MKRAQGKARDGSRGGRRQGRPAPAARDQRGGGTRRAILAAAEKAFADAGFAGARTAAIARAARVNKAMLYYHFKSKQALYEAVIEDHFHEFNAQALAVLEGPGPARAVLLRYVDLHFDFISARHRYASLYQQLMMGGDGLLERLVRAYFAPRVEAMDRLLARGTAAGEFRPADRTHTAISIAALIVFYFSASRVMELLHEGGDPYSARHLRVRKEEVMNFIRHGLFARPGEPLP